MRIFITGIRGFLGSSLESALLQAGHFVTGSTSAPDPSRPELPVFRLGETPDPKLFGDADVLIHGAHDFTPGALQRNLDSARQLCLAAGPRRQIFVSSFSARPDALGEYGISKYRIEQFFLQQGQTIVRPGLVVGAGGLFGRQLRFLTASPLIPLLDNGRSPIPVLALADYCQALRVLLAAPPPGERAFNLFNPDMPDMRELVEAVLRISGHRALLLPVSYRLARTVLSLAERLRLPLPATTAGLEADRLNRQCVHRSNLQTLVPQPATLQEMLQAALTTSKFRS